VVGEPDAEPAATDEVVDHGVVHQEEPQFVEPR
jgi:hypothetical protein